MDFRDLAALMFLGYVLFFALVFFGIGYWVGS
jgi:hypothetical protein